MEHTPRGKKTWDHSKIDGFEEILRQKLAPGAHINFFGCHTGEGLDSVAAIFSKRLPGTRVVGSSQFVWTGRALPERKPKTSPDIKGLRMCPGVYNQFINGEITETGTAIPFGMK